MPDILQTIDKKKIFNVTDGQSAHWILFFHSKKKCPNKSTLVFFNTVSTIKLFPFFLLQDEKNQMLVTNIWLKLVSGIKKTKKIF